MIQLSKLMTNKIVNRISFDGLVIVLILAVAGIAYSAANAEIKKDVSCLKEPSKKLPPYVLSTKQDNNLREKAGTNRSQIIRETGEQVLLRVVGLECGKINTETVSKEWYKVTLPDEKPLYIAKHLTRDLNKEQTRVVKAWASVKKDYEVSNFEFTKFEQEFLESKLPKKNPEHFARILKKKWDSLRNEMSIALDDWENLEKDTEKFEKNVHFQDHEKFISEYNQMKMAQDHFDGQILKLRALLIDIEAEVNASLKSGDGAKSDFPTQSKDGELTLTDKKSQAPAQTTKDKQEKAGQLAETAEPTLTTSTPGFREKTAGQPKPEMIEGKKPEPETTQADQQPKQESNSLFKGWDGFFLVLLLTFITVGFIIAFVFLCFRVRDLRDDVYRRDSTILNLRHQLERARSISESERLGNSATSLYVDEQSSASRGIDQELGEVHFPIKPEPIPEPEQVDEGPTIEEFVADYKGSIYDAGKVDGFKTQWSVVGASRKPGTDREELGTLVFEPTQQLNQVDFWCAPTDDANTFLVLPSRKQAASAATLASDDGRPGQKLFRGIFEIIGGTMFELLNPANAIRNGETLTIRKKGKVNLPTNSR